MQFAEIVELNVGGVAYSTTLKTLTKHKDCVFAKFFLAADTSSNSACVSFLKDAAGRVFVDRDGELFKYVLDFLRCDRLTLPAGFNEHARLREEAAYYQIAALQACLNTSSSSSSTLVSYSGSNSLSASHQTAHGSGIQVERKSSYIPSIRTYASTITVGYRGTFQSGKDGLTDVKFRKLARILVAGKLTACRDVFGETLNESRDADIGDIESRYSSRLYLKHTSLEQAFDMLYDAGFRLTAACGTSPCTGIPSDQSKSSGDSEENRWQHYNEFVFVRHFDAK